MADKVELRARLEFWRESLKRLREAYLFLLDNGTKSYKLGTEEVTRLDLDSLARRIEEAEAKVDELAALVNGQKPRKAFAVVPRDW